jgi:predicted ATPase/DNA-binding XRE family transcriptional regulator
MKPGPPGSFGAQLKALREAAGFTQEELATIAGLSVHAVSALERGERRRPHVETVRALSAALDLTGATRDALLRSARVPADQAAVDELSGLSLPLPPTALLGRDTELETLRHWLADPVVRLITLTGPGGAGKTRLALEIAHTIAAERATRVVFVTLAATRNPAFVASVIAEALGLSDVIAGDLPMRARGACGDRPTLLVLDNFEQVLDAAPLVGDLLTSVAPLRVLVTSRAPLRVRGEREYAVGPLELRAGSEAMSPADLARAPAVRLFLERVQDVQPGFRLTSGNGPTVAAICRRLDALPLALELAAPWMKVLTVEDLLRRLEQDVLLSTVGPRDLPERQQTINATVAWSYQLLGPNEQRAFRRFGALPGRFPIEAVAAVLGDREGPLSGSDDALGAAASLIDKSLLLRAETSVATRPMYQMLETVRAYAALELAAAGERDDAMEGLACYCIGEASRAAKGLMGPSQVEWLDRVRSDLESYRTTLAWLIERGRAAEAADIAWQLKYFWLIRGHAAEGLQWYEQILKLPSLPAAAESKALLGAAGMWWTQGALERARAALDRALALAHSVGDTETVAQAEHVSGHVEHALGNENAAHDMFARSIDRFRALAIPSGTGNALNGMAVLALATGDPGRAERLLDEAASVLRRAGPWFLTWALYVRAILAVRRGNPDEAIALMRESLTRVRELHDKFAFVYALVPLAAAAGLKGDDAWVARILGARDAVTERTGVTVSDKSVQDLRIQAERESRARLGPDRWAVAYAAGRTSSIDALLKDIDGVLRSGRLPIESRRSDGPVKPGIGPR